MKQSLNIKIMTHIENIYIYTHDSETHSLQQTTSGLLIVFLHVNKKAKPVLQLD